MRVEIAYKEKNKSSELTKKNNYLSIYLFGIRIKKVEIGKRNNNQNDKKANKKSDLGKEIIKLLNNKDKYRIVTKIIKTLKIKKLDMDLGINLDDPIYNAYAISFINAIASLVLASNDTDLNKIRYTTFISDKTIFLNIDCIISISLFKNIISIFKVILLIIKIKLKEAIENICKNKSKLVKKTA